MLVRGITKGIIVATAVGVLSFSSGVGAQNAADEEEKITLSPSSREVTSDAGEVIDGTMKIINNGDVAYDFTVYARPYSVNAENYDPNFTDQKPNADLYKWVQFQKTEYSIEPDQTVEVPYTIRVPENAAPGGHYGVLFAETQAKAIGSTGVARQKRVGKIVYATVNGEYQTAGDLKEFILPFWQTDQPIESSVRIENTGNVDYRAQVSTVAKDIFGRTKFKYTGDPVILPGTVRSAEMRWENAPSFGFFTVEQTAKFLDKEHKNSGYVLITPAWFPFILVAIILAGGAYAVLQRRKSRR